VPVFHESHSNQKLKFNSIRSSRKSLHFEVEEKGRKIWKYRPFTRVIKGWKPYLTVKYYIRLNEKEATGEIPYQKKRLRGLTDQQWEALE
jgi:hypothetical protein